MAVFTLVNVFSVFFSLRLGPDLAYAVEGKRHIAQATGFLDEEQ